MTTYIELLQSPSTALVIQILCASVLLANTLSFLAKTFWLFDLFSHFKIQYLVISVALSFCCLLTDQLALSAVMAIVAFGIFLEIQSAYTRIDGAKAGPANFKLIQYNKFYFNKSHTRIKEWLEAHHADADIMLINEALPEDFDRFKILQDIFPHQYPSAANTRFHNILILSKHPIHATRQLPGGPELKRHYCKVKLQKPGLEELAIYAFHASVPAGKTCSDRRNHSLKNIADMIRAENERNAVFAGDWNITAFSPHFKAALSASGLLNGRNRLFPSTTWPAFNIFGFLKIPIDHVLFSPGLTLVDLQKGPSMGSDHHPVIVEFKIKSVNNL